MENLRLVLAGASIIVLSACGGGGGGGTTGSGITYSGLTTPAFVSDTNGEAIALDAYQNGAVGQTAGTIAAVKTAGGGATGRPRALAVGQALREAIEDVYGSAGAVAAGSRTVRPYSGSKPGTCLTDPGSASYSISVDDQTGEFSGTLNFNGFCSGDVTLTGATTYSGSLDLSGMEPTLGEFSFTIQSLSVQACGDSFAMAGSLHYTLSMSSPWPTVTGTINMRVRDQAGKVYKLENYVATITYYGDHTEVAITEGRFYDPDHGYVTLSTTAPLSTESGAFWPSAGLLVATGGNGSKAKLTANPTHYVVELDTDPTRPGYEEQIGPTDWPSSSCI